MFRIRARAQIGVRIFDRIAQVIEPPLGGSKQGLPGRLRQALGFYRNYQVNGLQGSEKIIRELEDLKPDVIIGYPSSLGLAAFFIAGTPVPGIRPRLIITGGEVLHPGMRGCIEKAFCAPVFDMYGAHEFNLLAWECPNKEIYHVCDDNVILEILRDGNPVAVGEMAEIQDHPRPHAQMEGDLVYGQCRPATVHGGMVMPGSVQMGPGMGGQGEDLHRPPQPAGEVLFRVYPREELHH